MGGDIVKTFEFVEGILAEARNIDLKSAADLIPSQEINPGEKRLGDLSTSEDLQRLYVLLRREEQKFTQLDLEATTWVLQVTDHEEGEARSKMDDYIRRIGLQNNRISMIGGLFWGSVCDAIPSALEENNHREFRADWQLVSVRNHSLHGGVSHCVIHAI